MADGPPLRHIHDEYAGEITVRCEQVSVAGKRDLVHSCPLGRGDLSVVQKVVWIVVTFIWGIGPILYVLVGGGALW